MTGEHASLQSARPVALRALRRDHGHLRGLATLRRSAVCRRPGAQRITSSVGDEAGQAWWEVEETPHAVDVRSTADLLAAFAGADDRLVVVHFFAKWCGACRALHPKAVRLLSALDSVVYCKVEYDANKAMARRLGVKVLPFFQLYRGAQGKVDEFSCTLTKVQRLRDALELHSAPRCTVGEPTSAVLVRCGAARASMTVAPA